MKIKGFADVSRTGNKKQVEKLRRQMTLETTSNEKLLLGVQGDGFLEKSPPGRRRH